MYSTNQEQGEIISERARNARNTEIFLYPLTRNISGLSGQIFLAVSDLFCFSEFPTFFWPSADQLADFISGLREEASFIYIRSKRTIDISGVSGSFLNFWFFWHF